MRWFLVLALFALAIESAFAQQPGPIQKIRVLPNVPGLGPFIRLQITKYDPPLHLDGNKIVSDIEKPDWFDVFILPLLDPPIPFEAFVERGGKEFVEQHKITREKYDEVLHKPRQPLKQTVFFTTHVWCESGEFLIFAETLRSFERALPEKHEELGGSALRKTEQGWRLYDFGANEGLMKLPWNNLPELEAMAASGRAEFDKYGKLTAVRD